MARIGIRRAGRSGLGMVGVLVVLGLLGGCYTVVYPNQAAEPDGPIMWEHEIPYVEPTALGEYELCAFANDAVRQIITELWSAPDDPALTRQTVESYASFAKRLRELAAKADTLYRRKMIEAAAVEAEKYAAEVDRRDTYRDVDIDPTIKASENAFPGCDLDR